MHLLKLSFSYLFAGFRDNSLASYTNFRSLWQWSACKWVIQRHVVTTEKGIRPQQVKGNSQAPLFSIRSSSSGMFLATVLLGNLDWL
ncbi:hypothetical protein vseg_017222 [Gypsophila vaccaria]